MVKDMESLLKGIERLGYRVVVQDTKSVQWKRVFVYHDFGNTPNEKVACEKPIPQYMARLSFHNGSLYSTVFKGGSQYLYWGLQVMMQCHKILNHINFNVLSVQAYNQAYHFKEQGSQYTNKAKRAQFQSMFEHKKARVMADLMQKHYGVRI